MGSKLVTQPANNKNFLNCTKDSDCWVANANLTTAVAEATTATEKKKRCCMKFQLDYAQDTADSKASLETAKTLGWASKPYTYTKICSYDYPTFCKTLTGFDLFQDAYKDIWSVYCDGGASALVTSAIGIGAIVISIY